MSQTEWAQQGQTQQIYITQTATLGKEELGSWSLQHLPRWHLTEPEENPGV